MSLTVREAGKVWPGNKNVHVKNSQTEALKLEDLVLRLTQGCQISQIGFARVSVHYKMLEVQIKQGQGHELPVVIRVVKRSYSCSSLRKSPPTSCFWLATLLSYSSDSLEKDGKVRQLLPQYSQWHIIQNFLTTLCNYLCIALTIFVFQNSCTDHWSLYGLSCKAEFRVLPVDMITS